jgi:hypothetical protein
MSSSYPFFDCIVCHNRVQKVVEVSKGCLPLIAMRSRGARFSSLFDDESVFEVHCRGQGLKYNHHNGALAFGVQVVPDTIKHYNFSGYFAGMCCFCARHAGFGSELFLCSGCRNCVRKDILLSGVVRLFYRQDGSDNFSWGSHGWRALPSALMDFILSFVVGIRGAGQQMAVVDGAVVLSLPTLDSVVQQ